jgi:pimeloyl-ACP methyl ester carboxylesterase
MNLRHLTIALTFIALNYSCAQDGINNSGELQFVDVNGVEIAYRVKGEGEPVLLIPAVVADSFIPMMNEPALSGYQLITFHLPGQGQSGNGEGPQDSDLQRVSQFAEELLSGLGVEKVHVVGHSSGAAVGLTYAMANPDLIHSLVLMEPPAFRYDGFDMQAVVAEHISEMDGPPGQDGPEVFLAAYEDPTIDETVDAFMTWLADSPNWEEILSPVIPDVRAQATRALGNRDGGANLALQRSDFDRITQPTLWIWSDERLSINVAGYYQLGELIPQMETEYVSGVRHGLQLLAPDRVAEVVAAFLQRHPMN